MYYIHKHLTEYFQIYCGRTEHYRLNISNDMNNEVVGNELGVCGLFGKVLTGWSMDDLH